MAVVIRSSCPFTDLKNDRFIVGSLSFRKISSIIMCVKLCPNSIAYQNQENGKNSKNIKKIHVFIEFDRFLSR